jgi:hypothetical protein
MTKFVMCAVVAIVLSACSPSSDITETETSAGELLNEVAYDTNNPAHREDMICIAALSIGRDQTENTNPVQYQQITDTQNTLILKYDYSSQLNQHVEVRKMFLLQTEGNQYITDLIKKCS